MKASKRLKQSLAALEARKRMPVAWGTAVGHFSGGENIQQLPTRVIPAQPSPLARKLAVNRILAKLNAVQLPGDSMTRPPGCKRRGGKWVPR